MLAKNCCRLLLTRHGGYHQLPKLAVLQSREITTQQELRLEKQENPQTTSQEKSKLIYEGKLAKRILYLKSVSILSSLGLATSYGYVFSKKGFSIGLAGAGVAFTPFLLSPFVIAWFFKRYVTQLYYNPRNDTYTIHHYGLFLNKKSCTFKVDDVTRSDVTSMLNTFTVNKKPFFLHDEDLIDVESINLYKRMIKLENNEKL